MLRVADLLGTALVTPSPLFLQVFILKGFMSNVLEVFIPKSLQTCFSKCGFQRS